MSAGYDEYKAEAERLLWDAKYADRCIMAYCNRYGLAVMNIFHAGGEEKVWEFGDKWPVTTKFYKGTFVRCFILICKIKATIHTYSAAKQRLYKLGKLLEANKTTVSLHMGTIQATYSFVSPQLAHV